MLGGVVPLEVAERPLFGCANLAMAVLTTVTTGLFV